MSDRVQSIISLMKLTVEAMKKEGLEDFATPDVVEKIAISAFIDESRNSGNSGKMDGYANGSGPAGGGGSKTVTGTVEFADKKPAGKGFRYSLKLNGEWYSTFHRDKLGQKAPKAGDEVEVDVKQNDKGYWDIEAVRPIGDSNQDIPW
jgi:hypothetical protein